METVKTCPYCKLINPPTTSTCDCGYDFERKQRSGLGKQRDERQGVLTSYFVARILLLPLFALIGLGLFFLIGAVIEHQESSIPAAVAGAAFVATGLGSAIFILKKTS